METPETTTAVQTMPDFEQIQGIIGSAPATLKANITSKDNAIKAANDLILAHTTTGMTPELDGRIAIYTDKAKKTITTINEKRKPFTQMVTALTKQFTGCEADIKAKVDELQKLRDDYVTKLMNDKKEADRQAAIKLAKEKEQLEVKQAVKTALSNAFYALIAAKKTKVNELFDKLTLETFEEKKHIFSTPISTFNPIDLRNLVLTIPANTLTKEETEAITKAVLEDDATHIQYATEYRNSMSVFQKETIDKLPTKKLQLEELSKASEEEAKKLLEAQQKRAEEAAKELIKEQETASKVAEIAAVAEAAGQSAMASFGASFSGGSSATLQVKESTQITVKHNSGYAQIFQFWLLNEGGNLTTEQIEKKTIGQMKKFCEDFATKHGEYITSEFLEYTDKYKAK